MNFDLSALDNLQKKGAAAKNTKFIPTSRNRLRSSVAKEENQHAHSQAQPQSKAPSEPAPLLTGKRQSAQQEHKGQDAARGRASTLGDAVSGQTQRAGAAPAIAHGKKTHSAKHEHMQLLQSSAHVDKEHDARGAQLPAVAQRQEQQGRILKLQAQRGSDQQKEDPSTSGLDLAIVPDQAEAGPSEQEPPQRGVRGRAKEKPVIDPSTMSLKAIIKCAYAQERIRMEDERRRKKEEEDAIRAEGSEPQKAPAKPKSAQPRAMPMRPAPSLAPQLAMVNGKPVIMESSLTVQAQAEDLQRTITVEDNPKLNNASYSNRINNDRWTPQETELFFRAIRLFGTDFSLMEKMFPGRQRKALKFKLRREYKDNPERIDAALSGKGCDASSYQEVVKALQKHTEAQDGNLILGGPQEDPDLADVLKGPAADDARNADGAEAPAEAAAAHGSTQLASIPKADEQAAQTREALGRRVRAAAHSTAPEQSSESAQAAGKSRGSGRRKGRAPMASIAEEAAAPEQLCSAPPGEAGMAKGAWGGRRRRKRAAMHLSSASGLAHGSEQAQGQHASMQSYTAAAAGDQHAKQPDQASEQGHASDTPAIPQEAASNGTGVSKAVPQARDLPRPAAGRRKRQTPVLAALPDSSGPPGPAKRAKAPARPGQLRASTGKPMSRVELLAEAAGACAAEWEEKVLELGSDEVP